MIIRKLSEIASMIGGQVMAPSFNELTISGVSIDSRTTGRGSLFIPIVRVKDGHDYVGEAAARGAAASLWQADHPEPPEGVPLIRVDN